MQHGLIGALEARRTDQRRTHRKNGLGCPSRASGRFTDDRRTRLGRQILDLRYCSTDRRLGAGRHIVVARGARGEIDRELGVPRSRLFGHRATGGAALLGGAAYVKTVVRLHRQLPDHRLDHGNLPPNSYSMVKSPDPYACPPAGRSVAQRRHWLAIALPQKPDDS